MKQRVKDLKVGDVFIMSCKEYKVKRIHQGEVIIYPNGGTRTYSSVSAKSNLIIEILSSEKNVQKVAV